MTEEVQAVTEAPAPINVGELRSYLGMLQYCARFLPNLSVPCTCYCRLEFPDAGHRNARQLFSERETGLSPPGSSPTLTQIPTHTLHHTPRV